MADSRRLRRVVSKSRAEDTRNIYRRFQVKDGKEVPIPTGRATAFVVIINHKGREFREFAPTQAAAIDARDRLRQLLRDGIDPSGQRVAFARYADDWLRGYKGKNGGIRAETKREYRTELEQAKSYFKDKKLVAIKRRQAEDYVEHVRATRGRKGQPATDGTIRNAIAPLRALFFDALQNEIVRSNPFSRIAISDVVEEEEANAHTGDDDGNPKHLEPDELRRFLEALGDSATDEDGEALAVRLPRYWPLLGEFLAQTGLRISEAVALRWSEVDLAGGTVSVEWRVYRGKRGRPKSKNARRTVPISPRIVEGLRELRRATPFDRDDHPVFASTRGTHLIPGNIYKRVFKPAFTKAGVEWAGFHSLRHTAASFYFRSRDDGGAGANIAQVSRLLGHHAAGFTLNTYIHLFKEDELTSKEAALFDSFITNGSRNGSDTDPHRTDERAVEAG